MEKSEILKQNSLFAGIEEKEFDSMLSCLDAREKDYQKDDYILMAGNPIHEIGIVLKGSVTVIKEDYWGNRTIIGRMTVSDMFAESFSFAAITKLPVSVVAAENASILFIDVRQILTIHTSASEFNSILTGNMVRILANKNVMLMQKIDHISSRSIRDKLLSYLSTQAMNFKNQTFTIPYNRQELADYLCIDRSAMSSELGKLREEGLLKFHKNEFQLL